MVLSARIGGGKSAVASSLAQLLGWPQGAFGEYVRAVARQRGFSAGSREVLQQIGELLVSEEREAFCRAVLDSAEWRPGRPAVLEGLRHHEVRETLREITHPTPVIHVHLEVAEPARATRLLDRAERLAPEAEEHSTERQVQDSLPQSADFVVATSGGTEQTARAIVSLLEEWTRRTG